MQRPALNLPVGAETKGFGSLERDKPVVARRGAQLGAYSTLRSTRRRTGQGWQGAVLLTHGDWENGQSFKTPLGKIYGTGDASSHSEIFQIHVIPQGNAKPDGPTYELSPNRTQNVMAPFAVFLHGLFDTGGRYAGVLNMYPYGGRDDWQFLANPDVTDYWNYGWTSTREIADLDDSALFFDEALRAHLSLALTHWLKWDTLPEKILNGEKVFDDIQPKNVRENEIDMSEFK